VVCRQMWSTAVFCCGWAQPDRAAAARIGTNIVQQFFICGPFTSQSIRIGGDYICGGPFAQEGISFCGLKSGECLIVQFFQMS
jgi:hypothetical protein